MRRNIGRKVIALGGKEVVGYKFHADLERDQLIVVRGLGTAVAYLAGTETPNMNYDVHQNSTMFLKKHSTQSKTDIEDSPQCKALKDSTEDDNESEKDNLSTSIVFFTFHF